jgi:hypothetical protein
MNSYTAAQLDFIRGECADSASNGAADLNWHRLFISRRVPAREYWDLSTVAASPPRE